MGSHFGADSHPARGSRRAAVRARSRGARVSKRISASTFLEAAIIVDGSRDAIASRRLDDILAKSELLIEPVSAEQAFIARAAHRDFGRGSGDPALI